MERKDLLPLFSEAMQALSPHYSPAMQSTAVAEGLPGPGWPMLLRVRGVEPEALTPDSLRKAAPYAALEQLMGRLKDLVDKGFLAKEGDAYRLTDAGRRALDHTFAAAHQALAAVEPLPAAKLARLIALLRRLVEAVAAADEPAAKPNFQSNRPVDPGERGAPVARIDQYITDLYLFRDDAHIAAWRPSGVEGCVWETLSFIWEDDFAGLPERLRNRGHGDRLDGILAELVRRGWIEKHGDGYRTTEAGQQLRDAAEAETDRLYYAPFAALSDGEIVELGDLMRALNDGLNRVAAAREEVITGQIKDLWPLLNEMQGALYPFTREKVQPLMEEAHLSEPGHFFLLFMAHNLGDEPVSPERVRERFPYSAPQVYAQRLAALAEKGYFADVGGGAYRITEAGRAARQKINGVFYAALGEIDALPAVDLEALEGLLRRAGEACLYAPEPPGKTCLRRAQNTDPGDVAALGRIDFRLDLLNAYRDDSHLAAWRPHEVEGNAWEAFTFVWRGEAHTAAALAEKLSNRGHTAADYGAALDGLVQRGWLARDGDRYTITEAGKALREEVEAQTDRAFYRPWVRQMSEDEIARLRDLAGRLLASLKARAT